MRLLFVQYHTTITPFIMFSRSTHPLFKLSRHFFSIPGPSKDWAALAWETQKQLLDSERENWQTEKRNLERYHREVTRRLRLEDQIGALQCDVLRLRNNFNLRGALEFSLEQYRKLPKVPQVGKSDLLNHLSHDPDYEVCVQNITQRLQLRRQDVNACTTVLYHGLSKHAHGNTSDLVVNDNKHTITEVAALEAVFCALKAKGCFNFPLKIIVNNNVHML